MIPQAAPERKIARYCHEIQAAIETALHSNRYILGPLVESFETAFAEFCGVRHCVSVNSGTDALTIALTASGVGEGDEVITVSMTAPGTALAIRQCGAIPRFVDIDPCTRCMNVDLAIDQINSRTAAILPVHFHGYPMDLEDLVQIAHAQGITVIEDCAHAHGATRNGKHVGQAGLAGAFSFYPTKNLGCIGDGGAVITNDVQLANRMRILRSFETQSISEWTEDTGFNSRLDALQASILTQLLDHLDENNQERRASARKLHNYLGKLELELPPHHDGAVYHQFAIASHDRDGLRLQMRAQGIETGTHYSQPVHQQTAFRRFSNGCLPVTEAFANRVVSLPIQPEVAQGHEQQIATAIENSVLQNLKAA